ncbi:MAG: S9 family peptidase, partial [Muribaculaceae bacterium]|nr:S9 family peptidase [Muribaculaceae bacterium]
MIRKILLVSAIQLTAISLMAENHVARQWRATAPVTVRAPFMNDTIAPDGKTYKATDVLSSRLHGKMSDGTLLEADTAGIISLKAAATDGTIQMLQSRLRAARFAKGTLKVTSQLPFKVTLDGNDIITKESVQKDSITDASTSSAQLRLEPEHDVLLAVKVLSYATDSVADPTLKVEFVPDEKFKDVEVTSGSDLKRRFALNDTEYVNRVRSVSMSPDGKYLITSLSYVYGPGRDRSYSTLTDLKTGKVINPNLNRDVRWMPKGNELYYTVKAADGFDLIKVNPATGEETVALTGIPTNNITWSPNEDYFIYSHYEAGVQESGPLRRYATPDDRQPNHRQRWFLMKYDPATGLSERLTFGNHTTSLASISPDGKKIICSTSQEDPTVRPFYRNTFYQLDLETLTADTLVAPGPSFVNSAMYSPDGKNVLFLGSPAAFDGLGVNCGSQPIPNDYDTQIYLMDLATRKVKPMTRDFNPSINSIGCWNVVNGKVYFIGSDGFYNRLYALNT